MNKAIGFLVALSAVIGLTACGESATEHSQSMPESQSSSIAGSQPQYAGSGATTETMDDLKEQLLGRSSVPSAPTANEPGGLSAQESKPAQAAAPSQAFAEGDWSLVLVNAQNPLPETFTVETQAIPGYDDRQFDARAAQALVSMLDAAQADGCHLYLVSSYRSVSRQTALFTRKTNFYKAQGYSQQDAETEAAKLVARPGTSEHNLGLAADIVSADWYQTHDDLTADFETTQAFAWLQNNAASYGFILRYPNGKQAITGVDYEPWHYRYVGPTAAAQITAQQLTLEEYIEQRGEHA